MTLIHTPLDNMVAILQRDYGTEGLDKETVWIWRLKLSYAL